MFGDGVIQERRFKDIDFTDPFLNTLKEDYSGFEDWFSKKANCKVHVSYSAHDKLQAMLYLKVEKEPVTDVEPATLQAPCLKIGTFKIDAHGTRLGERFVKIIVDTMLDNNLPIAYITIFPKHTHLISILERFGFYKHGTKTTDDGIEDVYIKNLLTIKNNREKDFPIVNCRGTNKWILAIYPDYHTALLPDSVLHNEQYPLIEDKSYSNGIYKVYVGAYSTFSACKPGDPIIIYRTSDDVSPAFYRSVITSLCVIEDVRKAASFGSFDKFAHYCASFSIFDEQKLYSKYDGQYNKLYAIKMSYNLAFPKKVMRKDLLAANIIGKKQYIGFVPLSDEKFFHALKLGSVNASYIIN